MSRSRREFGGALTLTGAIMVAGCSSEQAVVTPAEITRPSLEQLHENETPVTDARDFTVGMARRVLLALDFPMAAQTGEITAADPASARAILERNGPNYTFTYGAYMQPGGEFVDPHDQSVKYFATGQ